MGFDPVVLTSPKHEQSWNGLCDEEEEINGFTYYRTGKVNGNGHLPIVPEIRLIKALGKRLHQVVLKEKPDVLHAHSSFLNAIAAFDISNSKAVYFFIRLLSEIH